MRGILMKNVLLTLIIPFLLSACTMFSPVKVEQTNSYVLNTLPHPIVKKPAHRMTMMVMEPEASAIYDTTQMAYSLRPHQVAYFAKHAWANTPPEMLQFLLMQTLQNTHYFYAVGLPTTIGHFDYVLNTQLMQFEQRFYMNTSDVIIVIRAQMTNASNNRVIAAKQFTVIERAPESTPYGGVVAANRAAAKILAEVANFCVHKLL